MASQFSIEIKDHRNEVMSVINGNIRTALEAVGIQAVSHAKQIITDSLAYGGINLIQEAHEKDNSRVDTGRLRNSIAHTVQENTVYIGSALFYAPYHELGTGIYASQPGGRTSPWVYTDSKGVAHFTRGLYPIHFLKKAASEYTEEYKSIIAHVLALTSV